MVGYVFEGVNDRAVASSQIVCISSHTPRESLSK